MADSSQDYFIKCGCSSPRHIVQLTYWPGYEHTNLDKSKGWSQENMSMNMQMNLWLGWWSRLKISLRYLFKPASCAQEFPWDGNWMNTEDIDGLCDFLNGLKRDSTEKPEKY